MTGCGILWHPGIAADLIFGTGDNPTNPDLFHVGAHEWIGDTIHLQIYRSAAPPKQASSLPVTIPEIVVTCISCNVPSKPIRLQFDTSGVAPIYIPEARQILCARLHLHGHGIDTTVIQKQRPPKEATKYFHLSRSLVGRVLVGRLALLYLDSTQDSSVAIANVGDELNIYSDQTIFYSVQHPNFIRPLYLLKSDAIRLE